LIEPVQFSSAKVAVIVRTTEIGEGFTWLQISLHIQADDQGGR